MECTIFEYMVAQKRLPVKYNFIKSVGQGIAVSIKENAKGRGKFEFVGEFRRKAERDGSLPPSGGRGTAQAVDEGVKLWRSLLVEVCSVIKASQKKNAASRRLNHLISLASRASFP